MPQPPDPKTVIDSIGDGVVALLALPHRVGSHLGANAHETGERFKSIGLDIERRMPDDPGVLPDALLRGVGTVVKGVLGTVESIAASVDETGKAVGAHIKRVTG